MNKNSLTKSYQIKAGFLLHFTSFVEWPKHDFSTLKICIIGQDPFGSYLDDMLVSRPTNRKGKKIEVKRLPVGYDVTECQLVFVTKEAATPDFWEVIPKNHSILLVGEFEKFIDSGGLINFYSEKKRIRIEINIQQVEKSKLNISSELLKLSRIIKRDGS